MWRTVFNVGPKDFQTMVAGAKLVPVDGFEFRKMLEQSALKKSRLFESVPSLDDLICYKRVFNEQEERKLGGVYAVFDPAASTAAVYREYHE